MSKIYRFSYQGHEDTGVAVVNSLHYQTDLSIFASEPSADNILSSVSSHLLTAYRACIPGNITVDSAELREELPLSDTSVPASASLNIALVGTLNMTTAALPDAMCMIVKLRSNAALRSARGYIALPSPRDRSYLSTSRAWTGVYLSAAQTLAALLDDDITLGSPFAQAGLHPVVYSRTRHDRNESPWTFQVVEAIPRTVPSWRRSRMTAP